jgi:hypothetical protein
VGLEKGLAVYAKVRTTDRAGKEVAQARRHLSDWPCRRIRAADASLALPPVYASPTTNGAIVGISNIRS